ncbi:MAG TPA: glycerol-3-phosphate dehydrogenase/oxidase [Candidatus Thermoplasmatota archaeon]|nr:glycerol-3-phosphate dehydrogenase/oxidase [Candidatus Thermoplasmatota archaeon]
MEREWERAVAETFDLVVVGGGINGTGAARDAARRGLRVCLVERHDFGYGTTGRSTRLIHGGLRYLREGDFGLVRESLRERELLLHNAPHLVEAIPFLIPFYEGMKPRPWTLRMGLALYDLLSYDRSVGSHRKLTREETLAFEPSLNPEGLKGGAVYYDGQVRFVERLCVENALDAAAQGAVLLNHAQVMGLTRDVEGKVNGVTVRNLLTGESADVKGRAILDATGPWLGRLNPSDGEKVRMTKGVHLATPRITEHAVLLFAPDGRVFFSIPWFGMSITGTTDTDYRDEVDTLHATRDDVKYLQEATRDYFPNAPIDEVAYTWAGVRALINVKGVSPGAISRKHLVLDHAKHGGPPGLVSIVGGKITPYRAVTEEAVNVILRRLGEKRRRSVTRRTPLPGAQLPEGVTWDRYRERAVAALQQEFQLPERTARHLLELYGTRHTRIADLLRLDPGLARPVCEHALDVWAQVELAAEEEMARSTADVLLRRTTVGYAPCQGLDAAPEVARYLGKRLGWTEEGILKDLAAYQAETDLRVQFR